jgi:hypothetical protein
MKKFLVLTMAVLILLTACAAEKSAGATATPTKTASAIADTSMATPEIGSAKVLKIEGIKAVQLHSRPDVTAPISGVVHPDEDGKLLGVDGSGKWVLVQINDQTGWALFQLFAITYVQ